MKVVVVGGGISGLATAHAIRERAQERGIALDMTVLEASERLGGTIHTSSTDGFRCEWGPNGFLDSKPDTLALVEKLGLKEKLLPSDDSAARRFVMVDGELIELPTSPGAFLKSSLLPWSGRFRVIWERLLSRGGYDEESIAEFAIRRLGRHAFERMIDPFVSGIFAGDPHQLSVRAALPRLVELESEYGSLIKASAHLKKNKAKSDDQGGAAGPSGRLTSFAGGLSVLIEQLGQSLGNVVSTQSPVHDVRQLGGQWVLSYGKDQVLSDVDVVVLAIPAHSAATVLSTLGDALSEPLKSIRYAPVSVVALGFERAQVNHDLHGFGFLVPSREEREILGCLWTSSIFPGQRAPVDHVLLRTIVGGARQPEIALRPDTELMETVLRELDQTLGITGEAKYWQIIRYRSAIPQYEKGHSGRVAQLDSCLASHPGLYLTGNAFRGVGINDCTREAIRTADRIFEADNRA